ncbi:MAG: hypothetical protein R3326_06950 [Gemmatimonadota bacterium]|nr:hypothetical protein [Gemmatimonadota bacterium]
MSPLRCNTVQEALWERAASAGPAPMSPATAEHLAACPACRGESLAVRELLETARSLPDPAPPADVWDGFEEELHRAIDHEHGWRSVVRSIGERLDARAWKTASMAAALALAFGLGAWTNRDAGPDAAEIAERREALIAGVKAELGNDARLESYVDEIESLMVAYRAAEHGSAVETFRQSLPATQVAGPGIPSESDRNRLERQRAVREQIRTTVIGMLATEIESESHGFDYIDRRIASIAGQQLLYFVR